MATIKKAVCPSSLVTVTFTAEGIAWPWENVLSMGTPKVPELSNVA